MKTLIVEDDFTSRTLLQEILKCYGTTDVVTNGQQAVDAVRAARKAGEPYDLICLDIMMPEMDGQQALREIRDLENDQGVISSQIPSRWTRRPIPEPISSSGAKIVMITALSDRDNVLAAFKGMSDAYLTKPIRKADLLSELRRLKLID